MVGSSGLAALERCLARGGQQTLCAYIAHSFPRLRDWAEDLVQAVLQEVLEGARRASPGGVAFLIRAFEHEAALWRSQGVGEEQCWLRYLRRRVKWRAIDWLRQAEHRALVVLGNEDGSDTDQPQADLSDSRQLSPSAYHEEAGRRREQVLLLSDVLREFTDWCEEPGRRGGATMKELYERRVRGQGPSQIAAAMGLTRNTMDQTLKRAREWIMERIRRLDVDQSVFRTIFRGRADRQHEVSVPIMLSGPRTDAGKGSFGPPFQQEGADGLRQPPRQGAPVIRAIFCTFEDVLRFVVDEMGALCPSESRLEAYRRRPRSEELRDVRYHVEEGGCRLCQEAD